MPNRMKRINPSVLLVLSMIMCLVMADPIAAAPEGHQRKRAVASRQKLKRLRARTTAEPHLQKTASPLMTVQRNPAVPRSISPNLTRTPAGRVLLSWLEPKGNSEYGLRFAIRQQDAWTEVRTVTTRRNFMKHPAELPVVTMLSENNFVALWTQGKGVSSDGEDVYASGSRDGGRTWLLPVRVHRDNSTAEHGLVSMLATGADQAMIVWLDGRDEKATQLMQAALNADMLCHYAGDSFAGFQPPVFFPDSYDPGQLPLAASAEEVAAGARYFSVRDVYPSGM